MEKDGTAQVKKTKRARVRGGGTVSAEEEYLEAKSSLMDDCWKVYTLCGSPLCIILFDPYSKSPQTWPSSSLAINSVIDHYKSTTASATPAKKKLFNLTHSDLGLALSPHKSKLWEKDLHPAMIDLPLQQLEGISCKIDDTLTKIDAMLMTARAVAAGSESDKEWGGIVRMIENDDDDDDTRLYGQSQDLFDWNGDQVQFPMPEYGNALDWNFNGH